MSLEMWPMSVSVGSVFWYRGDWPFDANREKGHHFIVVGIDEERQHVYYVVNGTSQVSSWKDSIGKTLAPFPDVCPEDTYVVIPGGQIPYFPRETMVNCNMVHSLSFEDLQRGEFRMVTPGYLDDNDLDFLPQILRAVVASPQVSERAKRKAKDLLDEN